MAGVKRPWPWPADSPLDRSRRVASAYRAALEVANKEAAAHLDRWAIDHGQGWVAPSPWPYADDDLITCEQLADACHVEVRTVYRWHQRGLPYVDTADGVRVRVADFFTFYRSQRRARLPQV
ncbi:MAG TPA: hypothetical protein VFX53_05185 [Pedococcus sp.]|nr:hypothetical protein [Pedococcus sp.]